ncbi:unnamed protein product [Paramecium sonneborni]|uniref:Uncharacterized protein n=1 Tax=Paramecium sonneborni TaxID=65129 RepID=A0A8S1QST1_9CILI|nr:unnamed protein product [Paramecium sonneborni]
MQKLDEQYSNLFPRNYTRFFRQLKIDPYETYAVQCATIVKIHHNAIRVSLMNKITGEILVNSGLTFRHFKLYNKHYYQLSLD